MRGQVSFEYLLLSGGLLLVALMVIASVMGLGGYADAVKRVVNALSGGCIP